jgi:HK97 family phage prohead protease
MVDAVQKDFASVTKAVGERQIRVIVSTADVDRSGDIVDPNGIDFTAYRNNPVVLYQHDHDEPIARCVEVGVVNGRVEALVQFPEAGAAEKSDEVYNLIKAGVLNAVSIGFIPLEYSYMDPKEPWSGRRFTKSEIIEFSVVSVPANANALIIERKIEVTKDGDEEEPIPEVIEKPDVCPHCGQPMPVEDGCGGGSKPKPKTLSVSKARNALAVLKVSGG